MRRPLILTIEGPDGVGKTTLVNWLKDHPEVLASHGWTKPVICCQNPGSTELGNTLRQIVKTQKLPSLVSGHLFMAAAADMYQQYILPYLTPGQLIVLDRGLLSALVYQVDRGEWREDALIENYTQLVEKSHTLADYRTATLMFDRPQQGWERLQQDISRPAGDVFDPQGYEDYRSLHDQYWVRAAWTVNANQSTNVIATQILSKL